MTTTRRSLFALAAGCALAAAAPALASGGGERKKGGGASFLQLPTMTASIVRSDGRRGVLTVECGVDVPDAALRTRAEQLQPRLRDQFRIVIQNFGLALRPGGVPDADRLARDLQATADRVLGRTGAKLLLGTVLVN